MREVYHEPAVSGNPFRPLDVEELSALTGWSRRLCWDMARRGELPTIRVGRRVFFPRPAVLALLAQGNAAHREEGHAGA